MSVISDIGKFLKGEVVHVKDLVVNDLNSKIDEVAARRTATAATRDLGSMLPMLLLGSVVVVLLIRRK